MPSEALSVSAVKVPELRPASQVMQLDRIGSMFQTRLSFARSLVRQMIRESWQVETERFDLDENGYGDAVYRIHTPRATYSFVLFSRYLDPSLRSDRVIAQQWDLAFALCEGSLDEMDLQWLAANIPRQEAGRCLPKVLTLSRANRSQRNFEAVVNRLSSGQQPDPEWLERVGYLYRTTAVYGNGKFGLGDYDRLRDGSGSFARPFSAEMFTVFMARHFTLAQVEHIARCASPSSATTLATSIKRYIGIGNSTGLGMAPFLISHPRLIDRWIQQRETAIARTQGTLPETCTLQRLGQLIKRAKRHLHETHTDDSEQGKADLRTISELSELEQWLASNHSRLISAGWPCLVQYGEQHWSLQTQELLNSLLLEIYPKTVNALEDYMSADKLAAIDGGMPIDELKASIETRYAWALAYDFTDSGEQYYFWYRATNKEEPRLGIRHQNVGEENELDMGIARSVRYCHDALCAHSTTGTASCVSDFLLARPEHRGIVRRIQNISCLDYGDIRSNLLGESCRPLDLLRGKLSFFGAGKFDPKSDRWVRITLFQGAPLVEDLADVDSEYDWFLPVRPNSED